jgi:hypothetical protein
MMVGPSNKKAAKTAQSPAQKIKFGADLRKPQTQFGRIQAGCKTILGGESHP